MNRTIIQKEEVLRYLGYQNQIMNLELSFLIDSCINECMSVSVPRYTYAIMDCHRVYTADSIPEKECKSNLETDCLQTGIRLVGTNIILKGGNIFAHLKHASKVAIIAATLGASYDNFMRISQAKSVTRGLIFDACGSEYIEKICENIELEISNIAARDSMSLTTRFSPGYGDFPLEQQKEIIQLLNADTKIGLTCTPSCIMLPRKSITAVIGFISVAAKSESRNKPNRACDICKFETNCNIKKEGGCCGH
ncbi:MAG: hypothetical protein WBH44_07910 [Proteocatella sp.]